MALNRVQRISTGICLSLFTMGLVLTAARSLHRAFHVSMASGYESKRGHVSSGRVLSIATVEPDEKSLRICYSIDSFSDIRGDFREEYLLAEKTRTLQDGPRCIVSPKEGIAANLKAGDPLEVDYLLYGGGFITVSRLLASGQEISLK